MLRVFGKDGKPWEVTQGKGLGIREHDDVMLSFGYSHKVTKIETLSAGEFLVITLEVPSDLNHHAENRFLEAYNGILEVKIIADLLESELPAVVSQIPAFNQIGPVLNPDVKSIFSYRGIHATNPITGTVDDDTTVDQIHLHGETGRGFRSAGASSSSDVQGRYYKEGIHTVLVENVSNADVEFTYIYKWHEFE